MKLQNYALKFLSIFMLVGGFVAGAQDLEVSNPMEYSVKQSTIYSEGDANDSSGWEGCNYDESESDAITRIECAGTRKVLVHGGHMVTEAFLCRFIFEPNIHAGKYFVAYEQCEQE